MRYWNYAGRASSAVLYVVVAASLALKYLVRKMKRCHPLLMDLSVLTFFIGTPFSIYLAGQHVSTTIQREMENSRQEIRMRSRESKAQIDSLARHVFGER